ncbi:YitT family protein [Duncaniella dubosii]|uniref:YitT family protein n=2 Tax=Duncaniella dubosii TaxID=2518971 RepID=A0A4P7W5E5_9BACT|nr:YitT family protein [Duncaniella dubosii]MCX4285522.1 YitT family protein [Duncaniella dubosii]QCD42655.1 YitT family protein [Duncaniella dubosii]
MTFTRKQLWMSSRDYIMITLAVLIYGFGFSAFILPEKVVIGGVTGLGTIVYFLTDNPYSIGITQYAINLVLLAIAWKIVGHSFVYRTLYGATAISIVVTFMPPLFDGPLVPDQPFMCVCIGSVLSGLALGIVFIHNGSTGGTDIVGAIVAKKTNVSVGRTMLYVDFAIISSSYLFFHNITTVVYGFIVLFILTYMVDLMINTNRQAVQFIIISKHWEKIATAVNKYGRRGVTVLDGMGWYTKQHLKILLIVSRKSESVTIFRIVKDVDPDAFITQGNVNGVYGQGFDRIKLKADHELSKKLGEEADPEFSVASASDVKS